MSILRSEVIEHRRFRLYGDVMIMMPRHTRTLTLGLCLVTLPCVLGVVLGKYPQTEVTTGRLIPQGGEAKILPAAAGIVSRVDVHDGDMVRAGQALATITLERPSEQRSAPVAASLSSIDQQKTLLDQQVAFALSKESFDRVRLSTTISQLRAELKALDNQISIQTQVVASSQTTFAPLSQVVSKGFVSKYEYETSRQSLLGQQQDLIKLIAQRTDVASQLTKAQADLESLPDDTKEKVNAISSSKAALLLRRVELENSQGYIVTAPVSGRVSALQANVGSETPKDVPLMTIVGPNNRMDAELFAPSRAAGLIRVGQEVRITYDSFPQQRFGAYKGRILTISSNILSPAEINAPAQIKEPVYSVRVRLDDQSVRAYGETYRLESGMSLQGQVVVSRQSILDWALSPLNAVRGRA